MFKWLRRKRLSAQGRRKLQIAMAGAEEALIDTHVDNVLHLIDILSDEADVDHLLRMYISSMNLPDPQAAVVQTRLFARMGGHRGDVSGRYETALGSSR